MIHKVDEILKYLVRIDEDFVPSLSTRVDLEAYAHKLLDKADLTYELDEKGAIIALLACYLNLDSRAAFVSLVSVDNAHRGKGLGKKVFINAIEKCEKNGMLSIKLEVAKDNCAAISLYESLGFNSINSELNEHNQYCFIKDLS